MEAPAMSKPAALRDQDDTQLDLLLKETQQNLFRLRVQSSTERLEVPSEILKAKREIARILTIQRERQIKSEREAAGA
jgi:large subunit ribosomal protein L29